MVHGKFANNFRLNLLVFTVQADLSFAISEFHMQACYVSFLRFNEISKTCYFLWLNMKPAVVEWSTFAHTHSLTLIRFPLLTFLCHHFTSSTFIFNKMLQIMNPMNQLKCWKLLEKVYFALFLLLQHMPCYSMFFLLFHLSTEFFSKQCKMWRTVRWKNKHQPSRSRCDWAEKSMWTIQLQVLSKILCCNSLHFTMKTSLSSVFCFFLFSLTSFGKRTAEQILYRGDNRLRFYATLRTRILWTKRKIAEETHSQREKERINKEMV